MKPKLVPEFVVKETLQIGILIKEQTRRKSIDLSLISNKRLIGLGDVVKLNSDQVIKDIVVSPRGMAITMYLDEYSIDWKGTTKVGVNVVINWTMATIHKNGRNQNESNLVGFRQIVIKFFFVKWNRFIQLKQDNDHVWRVAF